MFKYIQITNLITTHRGCTNMLSDQTQKSAGLRAQLLKESTEHKELKMQFLKQKFDYEKRHVLANEVIKRQSAGYETRLHELEAQMIVAREEFDRQSQIVGLENSGLTADAVRIESDYCALKEKYNAVIGETLVLKEALDDMKGMLAEFEEENSTMASKAESDREQYDITLAEYVEKHDVMYNGAVRVLAYV